MTRCWNPILSLFLAFILFAAETVSAQVTTASRDAFPLPEVLKPNVEFWKNVYARYSEREVVIHDSRELHLVYEVVHLDSLFRGARVSSRLEWKKVDQIKKHYKTILLRLARMRKINLASLRGDERRVAALFGPATTPKQFRDAAKRLRGQSGLRERFRIGLIRSGLYLSRMREIFESEGVPLELLMLPHVESSFNYRAYSKLGAAGLWQFTRSTGRQYMKINYNVDQRLDPLIATRSAARLLKKNYETLGAWPLAITAYNHGRGGMKRAKRKFGKDIGKIVRYYSSRTFGFASRNFYSEFLAAFNVATNYRKHFGELTFQQPTEFEEFTIPDYVTVKTLLSKLDLSHEEFKSYNPALRNPVLQSRRRIPRHFPLRVPKREGIDIASMYAGISSAQKYGKQVTPEWHKIRTGENLSQIARRYRVRLSELMAANNIRNAHRIYAGQNLQIPYGGRTPRVRTLARTVTPPAKETTLADASDLTPSDKTVLDVPRTVRLDEPVPEARKTATPGASEGVGYISARPQASRPLDAVQRQNLKMVAVRELEAKIETVDEIMAMALPGDYVEMTRDMTVRVVAAPKIEMMHESFRDLDMPQNGQVMVEPDETLGHFADWLGIQTYKLRRVNRMAYTTPIRIGQRLWLSFENVTPEEFHRRRVEYHQGIEEDFYRNFRVQGEMAYTIRTGDSIWYICNRNFEIPHWLLKKHNPDRDLGRLIAGQEITIPLVEARFPDDVLNN